MILLSFNFLKNVKTHLKNSKTNVEKKKCVVEINLINEIILALFSHTTLIVSLSFPLRLWRIVTLCTGMRAAAGEGTEGD